MLTPQAKRRRLNEANKTLHKPFKSPFRTPFKEGSSSEPPSSDPPRNSTPLPAQAASTPLTTPEATESRVTNPTISRLKLPRANISKPTRALHLQTTKKASSTPSKPTLTREIMHIRNEIQILTQAHTLATSSKEEDMVILVDRWRTASRAAAEEVFASTRDRVNRMGGVGAWKERENEQAEWRMRAEREEMEAERERLMEMREEARERGEGGDDLGEGDAHVQRGELVEEKEMETFKGQDHDSFTMDMMLKTLNIDLKLIGYNKEAQRWDG